MSDDPASIEAWQEQEKSDIVTRLRVINHHTKKLAENEGLHYVHREAFARCENLTWEAANEIKRLRKRLLAEENAYDIMRLENEHLQTDRNNLALEVERLRVIVQGWELSERDSTELLAMLSKPDHPNAALRQAAKRHKQITSEGDMLIADSSPSRRTPMTDPDIMDIVTMLRAPDRLEPHLCAAAANEIEQLRKDWKVFALSAQLCIDRLTAERDEARRRVCEDAIRNGRVYRRVGSDTVRCETPKEVAEMMGWDCFKENTNV